MIRIACPVCEAAFKMPRGATTAEMSAWMRWHAAEHRTPALLVVHQHDRALDVEVVETTCEMLREAVTKSRDYDEGVRDAAQFAVVCLDTAERANAEIERGPRRAGAEYMIGAMRRCIAHELGRVGVLNMMSVVSPDAETVREQADALDIGKPEEGDDDET